MESRSRKGTLPLVLTLDHHVRKRPVRGYSHPFSDFYPCLTTGAELRRRLPSASGPCRTRSTGGRSALAVGSGTDSRSAGRRGFAQRCSIGYHIRK